VYTSKLTSAIACTKKKKKTLKINAKNGKELRNYADGSQRNESCPILKR